MVLSQEQFLNRYQITQEKFYKTGYSWDELMAIANHYDSMKDRLEKACEERVRTLGALEGVHSIRYRVKDVEHLIEKIIRKYYKYNNTETRGGFSKSGKGKKITLDNYMFEITDIIGIRILHLLKADGIRLHSLISDLYKKDQFEKPQVNIRKGDDKSLYETIANDVEIREERQYRSIHYTFKIPELCVWELQTRTIFEEGWGELDHRVRYPYFDDCDELTHLSGVLNRLAGVCDELAVLLEETHQNLLETKEPVIRKDKIEETLDTSAQYERKIAEYIMGYVNRKK